MRSFGFLIALCLTWTGTAQAQTWQTFTGTDTLDGYRGASFCGEQRFSGAFCVFVGCGPGAPLSLLVASQALERNGLRDATLRVDNTRVGAMTFAGVPGNGDLFAAQLSASETAAMLGPLRRGSAFSLSFQAGSDQFGVSGNLRASSASIDWAASVCPAAPATRRPPAAEPALSALDRLFLANECVATETQIWEMFFEDGGIGHAQVSMRLWTEAPDWAQRYDIVSTDPHSYRWKTGPCAVSPEPSPPAAGTVPSAAFLGAVANIQRDLIAEGCGGRGGTIDQDFAAYVDLDADGTTDMILDEAGIACRGDAAWQKRARSCGLRVCEFHIYLWSGDRFGHALTGQNTVTAIRAGVPPRIELRSHDNATGIIRWNGSGFSPE